MSYFELFLSEAAFLEFYLKEIIILIQQEAFSKIHQGTAKWIIFQRQSIESNYMTNSHNNAENCS